MTKPGKVKVAIAKLSMQKLMLLMGLTLVFVQCTPEEENDPPDCIISVPADGIEIKKGRLILMDIYAYANDGDMSEVRFYVDDRYLGSASSYPYVQEWDTSGEEMGTHTIKATAEDSNGSTTSDEVTIEIITGSFERGKVTDMEGNMYHTVIMGNQEWMAENLRATKYADGSEIPLVSDSLTWRKLGDNNTDKAYCWYQNNPGYKETYGALYTWAAAMNGAGSSNDNPSGIQGVCPDGWHVPSDAEWIELIEYLLANFYNFDGTVAGNEFAKSLAATSDWLPSEVPGAIGNDLKKNNSTGFSALPAGRRTSGWAEFKYAKYQCWWWSSGEDSESFGYNCYMYSDSPSLYRHGSEKSTGCSVRCLRD